MQTTITGNLTDDPKLAYTPSGSPVASFTVAHTPRRYDKTTEQWVDGTTLFMPCSLWGSSAEHVADSLAKGVRVVVLGDMHQRNYQHNGQNRSAIEMKVDEVGVSTKFGTVRSEKAHSTKPSSNGDAWDGGRAPAAGPPADAWGQGGNEPPY